MPQRGRPRHKVPLGEITEDLQSGMTKAAAAKKYGVSVDTIDRRLKEAKK